jgi:lysophospholipase L1-like esterase
MHTVVNIRRSGRRAFLSAAALLLLAASASSQETRPAAPRQPEDRFAIPANDKGLPGAGPIRRYEWFQRLWRERRSEWAGRLQQDRNAVVFLGDSITQGWGGGLGANFAGVKVANRGIAGDTTRGILLRLEDDVLALDPAAVVLLIGTNDLEEGATPEVIAGNLRLVVGGLERHDPKLPIVLCQVFPSSATKKRPTEKIKAVNDLYLAAVRNNPRVTYLETWPLFASPSGEAKLEEFPDLLHPNEAGYAKWAAALRPVLATLGLSETTPDSFTPEEGFESLFNGRDLTGWGYRRTSDEDRQSAKRWQASDPDAAAWPFVEGPVSFDGREATPDGRFAAIGGRLVVKMPPEYRKIQQLWTTREFPQDFVLKLEFRATPNADSGIYLRGPQLQCRDYRLAGPYQRLERYRPQDWNEIVVTVEGGVAHATCNGETLEAALRLPESGPIGLEGDRGQMEYRRIRIKVLSRQGRVGLSPGRARPESCAPPRSRCWRGRPSSPAP